MATKKGSSLSKTRAPKSERIFGSERNIAGSSSTLKDATSITFTEATLSAIKTKVEKHNKQYPDKKITIPFAKAVVRRGMGAYSTSHRPTITGGKPNSRVAWGLARLNAAIYKIVHGKSKSGKYNQDDDLLNELKMNKRKKYDAGGMVQHLASPIITTGMQNSLSIWGGSPVAVFKDGGELKKLKTETEVVNHFTNLLRNKGTFELPIECAVYVPSTQGLDGRIGNTQFNERIEKVQLYLTRLFGGNTAIKGDGGYRSGNKYVDEGVAKVVAFAELDKFKAKFETLIEKIKQWGVLWEQQAMGFELEGNLFYFNTEKQKPEMGNGGKIGFEGLAKKVAKRYEKKQVEKKYQQEYGKTYDKDEALEVGRKVAAKVYRQQLAKKMSNGGGMDANDSNGKSIQGVVDMVSSMRGVKDYSRMGNKLIISLDEELGIYDIDILNHHLKGIDGCGVVFNDTFDSDFGDDNKTLNLRIKIKNLEDMKFNNGGSVGISPEEQYSFIYDTLKKGGFKAFSKSDYDSFAGVETYYSLPPLISYEDDSAVIFDKNGFTFINENGDEHNVMLSLGRGSYAGGGLIELGDQVYVPEMKKSGVVVNVISKGKHYSVKFVDGTREVFDSAELQRVQNDDEFAFGGLMPDYVPLRTLDRMDGLTSISKLNGMLYQAGHIMDELIDEGFEKDEILYFLANKLVDLSTKYANGGGIGEKMEFAEGGVVFGDNGFTINEMKSELNKLFPDSFGFSVHEPEKNTRPNYDLKPDKGKYYGLDDAGLQTKLYFPNYKRDHDINYKIYQGGENTYFYFYLNGTNGNEYIGQFGFKDQGDVDSSYITGFIAFLMKQYGLPFNIKHEVYENGGGIEEFRRGGVSVTKGYRLPHGYKAVRGGDKDRNYAKGKPKVRIDRGYRLPHGYDVVDGAYNKKYEHGGGMPKMEMDIAEIKAMEPQDVINLANKISEKDRVALNMGEYKTYDDALAYLTMIIYYS